jgi:hypothetical protein
MKKQLILAALSAALLAAPFVDAVAKPSSGFSSSKSSSGFSTSKPSKPSSSWGSSSSSSSSSKRDSGSSWGSSASTTSAPAPKRDYGSSWGSVTPSRKAEPARPTVADYAPTNRVTPQPKPASGFNPVSAAAPQPAAGFSDTKTSTKKKLATVAGATAVGGALYAAGANHEAVAAYQGSQEPATTAAPAASTSGERTASATTTRTDSRLPSQASVPSSTYQAQQQPQVIIVKEAPRYRDHGDDAYWYQRGRDSAAREARIDTPSTYSAQPLPQTQGATRSQVVQPSAPAAKQESSIGSVIMWTFVILMILGALVFVLMQVMNAGSPKASSRPAARKSNYTL